MAHLCPQNHACRHTGVVEGETNRCRRLTLGEGRNYPTIDFFESSPKKKRSTPVVQSAQYSALHEVLPPLSMNLM